MHNDKTAEDATVNFKLRNIFVVIIQLIMCNHSVGLNLFMQINAILIKEIEIPVNFGVGGLFSYHIFTDNFVFR